MEVQLTDFENAAYSIFIVLLTRAILSFGLDFYIPISKVDENMKRAHVRNAAREGKFFFKKNVFQKKRNPFYGNGHGHGHVNGIITSRTHSRSSSIVSVASSLSPSESVGDSRGCSRCASPGGLPRIEDEYEEMTINEIINGKSGNQADASFPGLLGLVYSYLNSLNVDISTRCALQKYFDLIKQRANGKSNEMIYYFWCQLMHAPAGTLKTTATWIREFVQNHPEYRHDSVVSQGINFDLIHAIDEIERGVRSEESLLGT